MSISTAKTATLSKSAVQPHARRQDVRPPQELLAGSAYKVIYITSMVTVGDTQVWDLSEYPDAVVTRAEGYKSSYMFWVNATGNLTLQNICIDGGAQRWAAEDGTPFSQLYRRQLHVRQADAECGHRDLQYRYDQQQYSLSA